MTEEKHGFTNRYELTQEHHDSGYKLIKTLDETRSHHTEYDVIWITITDAKDDPIGDISIDWDGKKLKVFSSMLSPSAPDVALGERFTFTVKPHVLYTRPNVK